MIIVLVQTFLVNLKVFNNYFKEMCLKQKQLQIGCILKVKWFNNTLR